MFGFVGTIFVTAWPGMNGEICNIRKNGKREFKRLMMSRAT